MRIGLKQFFIDCSIYTLPSMKSDEEENGVEIHIEHDADAYILDEKDIQCKSYKLRKDKDSLVKIVVDEKSYQIPIAGNLDIFKAECEEPIIFDEVRKQSDSYISIPNDNEVALPIMFDLHHYWTTGKEFNKLWEKFMAAIEAALDDRRLFFVIPKNVFLGLIENKQRDAVERKQREKIRKMTTKLCKLEIQNKYEDALNVLHEIVALGSNEEWVYDRLSSLYMQLKRVTQAEIDEVRVAETKFETKSAYLRVANLYEFIGDAENERQQLQIIVEKFGDDRTISRRLKVLSGEKGEVVYPKERIKVDIGNEEPIGEIIEHIQLQAKEFDFYKDGYQMGSGPSFRRMPQYKQTLPYIERLQEMFEDAVDYEMDNNFVEAIRLYETIVAHHSYKTDAYERLIVLYGKAKLKSVVKEVLAEAIDFFSSIRERQKKYTLGLAQKNGKYEFAMDRIKNGKSISYYGGAFILYNPYNILNKWRERLAKMK